MANNIISSLGGGSGIDTSSLVSGLVAAERAPKESALDSREDKLNAQISAYGTLKSALSDLRSVLSPLANKDTFSARAAAFPDTDLITPNSLAAGAQTGSYQIEVLGIAQSQTLVMGTTTDSKAALGATGNLDIQFGAWTYDGSNNPSTFAVNADKAALSIAVDASDSLSTIAKKINDSDAGIQANIIEVGGQYQLMITAPSGADNALQITGSDASLSGFEFNASNYASVTETQQASDASIKVNGLAVTRQTNEIDDVIKGFNFTLNKASVGEKVNFSIEEDSSVAEQAVRDFVDAYNTFYTAAQKLVGFSKDEDNNTVQGGLATDGSAKAMLRQLRTVLGSEVAGIDSGYTALTNLGIRTERDGSLSIDEDDFSTAFNENFDLVGKLFAHSAESGSNYVDVDSSRRTSSTVPGDYTVEITQDPSKGYVVGNAIVGTLFDVPLDTSAGDYSFQISVNGTKSATITLTGTYNSAEEVRAELQSLINGDDALKTAFAEVDVGYDSGTGTFTFTSRDYGGNSAVSFSTASTDMANLGIETALVGVQGQDVAGTINGETAFGSGNVLLPPISSDAYGLNMTVRAGATAAGAFDISFSHGLGGELDRLVGRFLGSSGAIASREKSLDNQLDDVTDDREALDRRMEKYEARISAQFLAMEQIISTLNSTSDSLDGILDRLPFTASKN